MKKLLLLSIMATFSVVMMAQSHIGYTYDASGNRVKRQIVISNQAPQYTPQSYHDVLGDQQIRIYPNPTQGHLKVEVLGLTTDDDCMMTLYDLTGKQIQSRKTVDTVTDIDISTCPNGYYLLHIILNGEKTTWKIIKES